jgi:hypothetical protein
MARSVQGLAEAELGDTGKGPSGGAPEPMETVPKDAARGWRAFVRWLAWSLPDSPALLEVTAREFKVPR